MIFALLFISFLASVVGAVCGIGGGVIVKPVLDACGLFSISTVNFLSGCMVLSMSGYSVIRNLVSGNNEIDLDRGTFLGLGAAIGGIAGKYLFVFIKGLFRHSDTVGAVQAVALFFITAGTLVYTVKKEQIRTHEVENRLVCAVVGLVLGIMSSFLGIGGGPINLVVLFHFFSMPTKIAAQNSLYIILLSQLSSLLVTLGTNSVPPFSWLVLSGMVSLGILGGIAGRRINQKIQPDVVHCLFMGLLLVIMVICMYNFFRFV